MSMPRKEMKIKQKRKGIEWNYTYRQSRFMKETKKNLSNRLIASLQDLTKHIPEPEGREGVETHAKCMWQQQKSRNANKVACGSCILDKSRLHK